MWIPRKIPSRLWQLFMHLCSSRTIVKPSIAYPLLDRILSNTLNQSSVINPYQFLFVAIHPAHHTWEDLITASVVSSDVDRNHTIWKVYVILDVLGLAKTESSMRRSWIGSAFVGKERYVPTTSSIDSVNKIAISNFALCCSDTPKVTKHKQHLNNAYTKPKQASWSTSSPMAPQAAILPG